LRIEFTVTYADGTAAGATASVADQVAFEQQHDRSIARLADDFRLTDACWLAWHSLHRTGKTGLDFDGWLATVDNVEFGQGKIVPLEETTTPTGS
jgi:hypothetical protein